MVRHWRWRRCKMRLVRLQRIRESSAEPGACVQPLRRQVHFLFSVQGVGGTAVSRPNQRRGSVLGPGLSHRMATVRRLESEEPILGFEVPGQNHSISETSEVHFRPGRKSRREYHCRHRGYGARGGEAGAGVPAACAAKCNSADTSDPVRSTPGPCYADPQTVRCSAVAPFG
jgi:hypothetical protein